MKNQLILIASLLWGRYVFGSREGVASVSSMGNISIDPPALALAGNENKVEQCVKALSQNMQEGGVTREQYAEFLSQQGKYFPVFQELPVRLVWVFYESACMTGKPCVRDLAQVPPESLSQICAQLSDLGELRNIVAEQQHSRQLVVVVDDDCNQTDLHKSEGYS